MIVPLIGADSQQTTRDLTARQVQTLIDCSDLLPLLDLWLFCTKCKTPIEGANGYEDPVWTLRCRCTIHQYRRHSG